MSPWEILLLVVFSCPVVFVAALGVHSFLNPVGTPVPGHNVSDPACQRWIGDFAGVDLNARCESCNPSQVKS